MRRPVTRVAILGILVFVVGAAVWYGRNVLHPADQRTLWPTTRPSHQVVGSALSQPVTPPQLHVPDQLTEPDSSSRHAMAPVVPSHPVPATPTVGSASSPASRYWLRGVAITPEGRPIDRFELSLFQVYDPLADPLTTLHVHSGVGEFEVSWDTQGPLDLVARANGFAEGVLHQVTLSPSRGTGPRWEMVLVPGGIIRGQVINEAGKPVSGARVEFSRYLFMMEGPVNDPSMPPEVRAELEAAQEAANPNPRLTTDGEGRFELQNLPQGQYPLTATHPDYFPTTEMLTVVPGESQEVRLVLSNRGGTVIVHVVDAAGAPVVGRALTLDQQHQGVSDTQGLWRVEGLPPGFHRIALAAAPEQGRAAEQWTDVEVKAGQESHTTFEIVQGATLTGDVLQGDVPVVGVPVLVEQGKPVTFSQGALPAYAAAQAVTDAQGRFEVTELPPGEYAVKVAQGDDWALLRLDIAPSDRHRAIQIQLGVGRVSGTVRDRATGRPLAGTTLRLLARTPGQPSPSSGDIYQVSADREVETAADGRFEIRDVAPGSYLLRVGGPAAYEEVMVPVEVTGASTEQDITLEGGGQLILTVKDTHRVPLKAARVNVTSLAAPPFQLAALTDTQGVLNLNKLAAGVYEVVVSAGEDQEPFRAVRKIEAGQIERVDVMLERALEPATP